ncbi:hypothetical protein SAMN04488071_0764 [Kordiimonas lacus]|uniref:DUF192 domain-containing protein n=1 Tax=Kordiimonas lacus TaxID=637679 RepID=A0A1G6VMA3_9PROT|nr:hypothetical protein SAMN04488071_0764 [Kordiimonas lacus]
MKRSKTNMRQGWAIGAFFLSLFLIVLGASTHAAADMGSVRVDSENGSHQFSVELALTPPAQARGLMFRAKLDPDKGMLFIFPEADMRSFWMKNTLIPLDIIFIRENGTIINIVENAEPRTLTPRESLAPAVAVLEIAGGRARALGIKPGDTVRHDFLGNMGSR